MLLTALLLYQANASSLTVLILNSQMMVSQVVSMLQNMGTLKSRLEVLLSPTGLKSRMKFFFGQLPTQQKVPPLSSILIFGKILLYVRAKATQAFTVDGTHATDDR
jgi:hypothetical protein